MNGPLSTALEAELTNEVRRNGVVVWLDKDGTYTPFVDALAERARQGEFPFPVLAFRGSFLQTMLALDALERDGKLGSALDKPRLLVHMPGFNEENIRTTPVLELYRPGTRYRKALDTLVREVARGRVPPDAIDDFLAAGAPSLADAEAWLGARTATVEEGLAGDLERVGLVGVLDGLVDRAGFLATRPAWTDAEIDMLCAFVLRHTGVDAAWIHFANPGPSAPRVERVRGPFVAWLLAVEYVHDLRRAPNLAELQPLAKLSAPLVTTCVDLVKRLRAKHPDEYVLRANETEERLRAEIDSIRPEDLGRVDTFAQEEERVLVGALAALREGRWSQAADWAAARDGDASFWLQRDQTRRWCWTLVADAAALGQALHEHARPLQDARTLAVATERYAATAFQVDRAHRRFEQRRLTHLDERIPHNADLHEIVAQLREAYRAWADALATDFAQACRESGFLPEPELQQRTLFDQVVAPLLATNERTAYFLLDAFRFELAADVVDELRAEGAFVDLKPRLAELPTITSVGMNALAPVAQQGRLSVAGRLQGFRAGEFTVRQPADRVRAITARAAGRTTKSLDLAQVAEAEASALKKKLDGTRLVVVHGKEIDDAGEANLGLATFELTLRQIRTAWHHLRTAGFTQFVLTADHGFLLLDAPTRREVAFGTKRDPDRRFVLDEHARSEAGLSPVSLASLGYDGLAGYLLLREDTAVFATGQGAASFVHGGNSPQERVIPVVTITQRGGASVGLTNYAVTAEALDDVLGLRRLKVRVAVDAGSLGFVAARAVDLALRVPDRPDLALSVRGVSGAGSERNGRLRVPVGGEWTEVFFALTGPKDERARVEVFHPDGVERVTACRPEQWFAVEGTTRAVAPAPPSDRTPPPPVAADDWAAGLEEGPKRIFRHIEKHGAITEVEITRILATVEGSPKAGARAFRRFSLEFDGYLKRLPFEVFVETAADGKRYTRGNG